MRRHFICFVCLVVLSAWPSLSTAMFKSLPVQWQSAEKWQWQGQDIHSQLFTSSLSIEQLMHWVRQHIDQDLRLIRLSSAWVLSFYEMHTHHLLVLSAQQQGSAGWWSSLELQTVPLPTPAWLEGLYEHSWTMQSSNSNSVYSVLKPVGRPQRSWQQLQQRLSKAGWQAHTPQCAMEHSCQWGLAQQKLVVWKDTQQELWHVLWQPNQGEQHEKPKRAP